MVIAKEVFWIQLLLRLRIWRLLQSKYREPGQRSTSKKQLTSMSSTLEPAIWSRNTGYIVIHGEVDGRTVTKTKFLAQMGYI